MTHTSRKSAFLFVLAAVLIIIILPAPLFANGPLHLCEPGRPLLWASGGANIPFNPDQGDLGPLTNAAAIAAVQGALDVWAAVPTATTTFLQGALLPEDVTVDNYLPYAFPDEPDGLSAIVFDEDGSIFEDLFGPDSGILGFATPEWAFIPTCTITEGVSFLNGAEFNNLTVASDVMVHEFGHYQNLAHTIVNGQHIGFGDESGPTPHNTFGNAAVSRIETMYPFYLGPGSGSASLHRDDISGVATLYPEATFAATTGTIQGYIVASNETTRLTGVNVIARNVANPFNDAVSAISGDFIQATVPGSPLTGLYTLRGLTPGAQYVVFIDQIGEGGFSTPPLQIPGFEEFYSGAAESNNEDAPDPTSVSAPVPSVAGVVASGIDIILNAFQPGDILPVGDDGAVELALPFKFQLCGSSFESVFVNANGSLTFGAPSSDFTESQFEFLNGPPRAAGLWDDLDARARGVVTFARTHHTFTVSWTGVPEFAGGATSSNTFAITLHRFFDLIEIDYGNVSALDGLAGVGCGAPMTARFEQQTNLSALKRWFVELISDPAGFELFSPAKPFDLANSRLRFTGTLNYNDRWAGNNNTVATAKRISLPFDSSSVLQLTELESAGDRDFFKFRGKAGQIVAIELLTGQMDSFLGLFNAAGVRLASNDDGGAGFLSRLLVQLAVEGDYVIGVTSFPDTNFTGIGTETGRYVLSVRGYEGTLVGAGDDTSTTVPFTGFNFRFQGVSWSQVFVNSNGNLTFGTGNTDFSETVAEFLAGPPRIAPLWDDFDASAGLVIASSEPGALTIHFVSVPEFFSDSPNNFSVRMENGGRITLGYHGVLAQDGLVGITQGNGAADPGRSDLSRSFSPFSKTGTTFEQFGSVFVGTLNLQNPFDIPFRTVRFQ